jgi:hypothetical protein
VFICGSIAFDLRRKRRGINPKRLIANDIAADRPILTLPYQSHKCDQLASATSNYVGKMPRLTLVREAAMRWECDE